MHACFPHQYHCSFMLSAAQSSWGCALQPLKFKISVGNSEARLGLLGLDALIRCGQECPDWHHNPSVNQKSTLVSTHEALELWKGRSGVCTRLTPSGATKLE